MQHRPVVIVEARGIPVIQTTDSDTSKAALPVTAVEKLGAAVTLVEKDGLPVAIFNPDGSPYE